MMNLLRNLFEFDKEETRGEVLFFRFFELFLLVGTIKLAWDWGFYILRISDIVLPLGIARYVDVSFMFESSLPLINAALITILAVAGYLRATRYAYMIGFLLLHLQYAARYSLGEIPHSSNVLGMTVLGLALSMLVFSKEVHRRQFTLGFTYFYVGLGYTLAGLSKLVGTGVTWSDGRHMWMWIYEKSIDSFAKTGVLDFNVFQELLLSEVWISTLFLSIGLLTELCAFLMWWKPFRVPILVGVIALHIGIYLIMGIFFTLAFWELMLLVLPLPAWLDWLSTRASWMRPVERVVLKGS